MTATAALTVKDQELISSGLVESASVNSIADFVPRKLIKKNAIDKNLFICHIPNILLILT